METVNNYKWEMPLSHKPTHGIEKLRCSGKTRI